MLKKIAIGVAGLIALLLAFATTKPDTFQLERSTRIEAPPDKVFALINDFHRWSVWSPWEKLDPNMKRTFAGATTGQGAIYSWEGNKDVGSGRMEITQATSPTKQVVQLDFLAPFEAHNVAEFTLRPEGAGTTITWAMHGPNNFFSKVMSVFVSMDSLIGKDFEQGLANMKAAAEK